MPDAERLPKALLSARERDCCRLLEGGLSIAKAAAALGIARTTFHKHLSAVREKLGVGTTTQALLLLQADAGGVGQAKRNSHGHWDFADEVAGGSVFLTRLADALAASLSFDEAWSALRASVGELGIFHITLGVVAEPPGQFTNGGRVVDMALPTDIINVYQAIGGVKIDPVAAAVSTTRRSFFVDAAAVIAGLPREALASRQLGEVLLDNQCRYGFSQPINDDPTGGAFAATYTIDPRLAKDFPSGRNGLKNDLEAMTRLFCLNVQNARLLSDLPGLTHRQKDVLQLAARGFSNAEMAEHAGVSVRAVQQLLAGARDKLGARTTAAAVYRATVYRSLPI